MPSFFRKLIQWFVGGKSAEPGEESRKADSRAATPAPTQKSVAKGSRPPTPALEGEKKPGTRGATDETSAPEPSRTEPSRPETAKRAPSASGDSRPAPGEPRARKSETSQSPRPPAELPEDEAPVPKSRARKLRGRKRKPGGSPPTPPKGKKKKKVAPPAEKKPKTATEKAKTAAPSRPAAPRRDGAKPAPAAANRTPTASPGKSAAPTAAKSNGPPPRRKEAPRKSKSGKVAGERPRDRHGMPLFADDTDFEAFFTEEAPPPAPGTPERRPARPEPKNPRPAAPQTNRHGIPIFDKEADLSVYFSEPEADFPARHSPSPPPTDAPDEFERLMESALEGLDETEMISRKQDELPPDRRPSLGRRLRDYPPPQAELDLHGFTSAQAAEKTETFLRLSRQRGRRTVLIITGRGIHSDGRPVLPDVVESRIADLRRRNWILASQWERGDKRRSGALIVYLRPPAR